MIFDLLNKHIGQNSSLKIYMNTFKKQIYINFDKNFSFKIHSLFKNIINYKIFT